MTPRDPLRDAIERIVENELTGVPSWRIGLTNRLTNAARAALASSTQDALDVEALRQAMREAAAQKLGRWDVVVTPDDAYDVSHRYAAILAARSQQT